MTSRLLRPLICVLVASGISVAAAAAAATDDAALSLAPKQKRNVDGIQDNSFLIEEAYNQEPGVVQHIFTGFYGLDKMGGPDDRTLALSFTQEWPVFSQKHQFSYTVPYNSVRQGGVSVNGVGDVLLNYRYQVCLDEDTWRGFAPRFSLVLPTGDTSRGFGDDTLGYQWNLPFSTALRDRWFVHANAGLTYLPDSAGVSPRRDRLHYNLGASVIYAVKPDLHLMLECVGAWNQADDGAGRVRRELAAILSPGVRQAFNFANESQLVIGLAVPIGLTRSAPDVGVFLYVSFEHNFLKKK